MFGDEFRSCPIKKIVVGFPGYNNFQFNEKLKFELINIVDTYSNGKPTLVFCSTRKDVVGTSEELGKRGFVDDYNRKVLENCKFKDKKLETLVKRGVGYHHAGMDYQDRQQVEALFMTCKLFIICSTSTLAVGVNLPAYLVIIKGTCQYDFQAGKMKQYCDHDVNQMLGRAGRPQFDKEGLGVIMTSEDCKNHFERLVNGKSVIESKLHLNLTEHLNSEIALGVVDCEEQAISWLKSTFLYVRIQKHPGFYRFFF